MTRSSGTVLRSGCVALAAALAASLLTGCAAGKDGRATAGAEYVALGDSDSSGAGIPPVADARCARSKVNYPSLVAKAMHSSSFDDVTCGGATTTDLVEDRTLGDNTLEPQLDAVGPATRLVTLTIGLNDRKFSNALFLTCLSASGTPSPTCQRVLAVPERTLEDAVDQAADRVAQVLRRISRKAPEARVVLVGYPRYLPDAGSCRDRVPFVEDMVPRLRRTLTLVNERWKEAARSAGADYVDTYALSEGHDVCAADPWLNGIGDAGKAAPVHPFEAFHRAVADAIVALLRKQ